MKTGLDLMNELQRAVAAVPPDEINECSWNEQKGVLISGRDARSIIDFLKNRNKVITDFAAQSVREDRESRWISVSERLPEDGEQVIVLLEFKTQEPESIASGYNSKKGFYNLEDPEHYWSHVTKWQPLPSPPINH